MNQSKKSNRIFPILLVFSLFLVGSLFGPKEAQAYRTELSNGIAGINATVCPGASGQKLDGFSFQVTTGGGGGASTDTVTTLTVTTTNYAAIASMQIWNEAGTQQYFNTVNNPGNNTWNFSGGTTIPVATTLANYKILVTYKNQASAPAGNTTTTAYVSAYTCANTKTGTDTADTTLTLNNSAPANAVWGTITPGGGQITLNWTNPGDADFSKVLILRKANSAVTDTPAEGTIYTAPGTLGSSVIIYVNNGTSYTDTGLTSGSPYYYKIFAYDTCVNYASGAAAGPYTPIDTTPPASSISSPASGAVLNLASSNPVTISGTASDNVEVSSIEVSTDGGSTWNTATCTGCPGANVTWTYNWTLPAEQSTAHNIRSRATDSSINIETPGAGINVTVDRVRPTVSSTIPANGATGITMNSNVTINFSEAVDCNTVTTSTVSISPNNGWARSSCSGSQAVFTPSNQSRTSATYTVTVGTGVTDAAGNAMASQYQFSYTTSTFSQAITKVPISGSEPNGAFTVSLVQTDNATRDTYENAPVGAYDESVYQEYFFDFAMCSTTQINSVTLTFNWQVAKVPAAKLEVFDHTGAATTYDLNPPDQNNETTNILSLTNITTWEDLNKLRIRFLAYKSSSSGGSPAVDYVKLDVAYSDPGVCIGPENFSYTPAGTTASFAHLVSADPNSLVDLSSSSQNGWPVRLYRGTATPDPNGKYIDTDGTVVSVTRADNNPISQATTDIAGYAWIIAETDVPSGNNYDDVETITVERGSYSASTTDTAVTPPDGTKDSEYSAPYAIREFFDYGPDPNRASGEVYRYVKNGIMHIYYAQNERNINDNTYNGFASAADNPYGDWAQLGWTAAGLHTLTDLLISDKTEFIFYDQNGNIKLDFFSDYLSRVTASSLYPAGYHSCGFSTTSCSADSDASLLINNTGFSSTELAKMIGIESSMAYNLNHYTSSVGGQPIIDCGSYGTSFNLTNSSPPIDRTTYALLCPAAADYQFSYALEVVLPIEKIFPNEPALTIVARAHNSPNKNGDKDNPPTPATASIGDYVWYDMNGNGAQDVGETGIPNVRVVLYWDKNGDGLFSEDEALLEAHTDANGYYLFDGIYGGQFYSSKEGLTIDDGQYKVWVDESTITPGFGASTANPYVLSNTISGASRGSLGNTESCRTADFGYKPNGGVIGDFVWFDANNNGIEDQGEMGIANVTLNLLDASTGNILQTATTDSDGKYFFTGLAQGNYKVQVTDTNGVLTGYTHTVGSQSQPNPTATISLPLNGVVLYADFGYYTNTACATGDVSGKVFFDQNWNRVFDAGADSGLAGVGVSIWQDANNNGLLDETDPFIGSTTTNSSGDFHFYGLSVSSGGTAYILQVPNDPSGLSKFYPGGGNVVTLTTSACSSTANFPYVGSGVIGDFIWNDLNNNGIQDAGEPGITGVTVQAQYCDTLSGSCSNTFTFNTTTDSTGHYMFSGLRITDTSGNPGARYRIIVTDTNHVLTGWNASPQLQGGDASKDSNNPSGTDVILGNGGVATFGDLTIDFGYNNPNAVFGSIGDYIWNDTNGDGVQNAGEVGIANVTLDLRDGNGVTLATTTTSSGGAYLFQGLPVSSGGISYQVVITDLNGVLNGWTMTTNPNTLNVTLTTSVPNNLNADAGFWVFGSIGDYIWYDQNGNGLQDEPPLDDAGAPYGLDGVTVDLRDSAGSTIATTTTSGGGYYLFERLPVSSAGIRYQVVITDLNGVLNGYTMSTVSDALNVTLTSDSYTNENVLTADAGFYNLPTLVTLSLFNAFDEDGRMVVEWETASEAGTIGFYLFRLDNDTGQYLRLNDHLLPGLISSHQGGKYRLIDNGASLTEKNAYKLVEVESSGARRTYGPFIFEEKREASNDGKKGVIIASTQKRPLGAAISNYIGEPRRISAVRESRTLAADSAGKKAALLDYRKSGEQAKISITENGLYYLGFSDIAKFFGISQQSAKNMIKNKQLSLSNKDQLTAYISDKRNEGIYFYGQGMDSIYTKENVYWLKKGKGSDMKSVDGIGPAPSGDDMTFVETRHFEEDIIDASGYFSDPTADYWFWDYIYGGYPDMDKKTFILHIDGLSSASDSASLTVNLQGASDSGTGADHHVSVSLNGHDLGESRWAGAQGHTSNFSFGSGFLKEGDNTLELTGILDDGVPYSVFLIESFDLTYRGLYQAVGNKLIFKGDINQIVTVSGFTNSAIMLFDISEPLSPKIIKAATIDGQDGNYRISFRPASPDAVYIAVTADSAAVGDMIADAPSSLKARSNIADYLIITTSALKDAAASLASYRQKTGLLSLVVDLEDIMDEFNYGIYDPKAVKDFLSYAHRKWIVPPGYVVLAGDGTYDYKDILGYGDNIIPAVMVSTPQGLFPSDNYFADIDGDHVPDMAIGRLPAVTPEELRALIDKIIAYENSQGGEWEKQALMLSDIPDDGGDFPAYSDDIASQLPESYIKDKVYLSNLPLKDARDLALNGINSGAAFMTYFGHGGLDRLTQDGLLLTSDVDSMINGTKLPVVTAMTCEIGNFAFPGIDSLAEALLLKQNGGAAAVWSPTGWSVNSQAGILDKAFFRYVFDGGRSLLGDVIRKTLKDYKENGSALYMLDIYNLLGDPALKIRGTWIQ